jgi:flagellar protein FliT
MLTGQDVLSEYAAVAALTAQMRAAAEAEEWDRMVELEQAVGVHVATLKQAEGAVQLTADARQAKIDCIRRILADDRKIRDLTTPWMAKLSALLHNSGTQRRLATAYGSV